MADDLLVYAKNSEAIPDEVVADLGKRFHANEVVCYRDSGRGYLKLREMISHAAFGAAAVAVPSVHSLADTQEGRKQMLDALLALDIPVIVSCYPHSRGAADSRACRQVLSGIYDALFLPFSTVDAKQGRKAIDYPEGWEDLYRRWEAGDMTARDFMRITGLKRGTFYHLVAEYSRSSDG